MKDFLKLKRVRWGRAGAAAGVLLVAACTSYHPTGNAGRWTAGATIDGPAYYVRHGDTVSSIAERAGVDWRLLALANGLDTPYTIYPGQTLRLPGGAEGAPPAVTFVAAHTPAPAAPAPTPTGIAVSEMPVAAPPAQQPAPAVAQPEALPSDGVYRVRAGDHLLSIARRFGVPMQQIAALNRLSAPYALRIGQELQLPVAMAGTPTPSAKPVAHIAAPALSGDGFMWPLQGKVVGRFGQSDDGLRRDGINIAARRGTPVRAAEDGVVVYADEGIRGYGRMILLRHSDDYVTTYAHNATLLVSVGDVVRRGQIIARVGDTGSVQGDQLHFEIRKGLTPLDPEDLLVHETTEVASSG
jgi:murein DD-endopeptidase MepM/ murein hydrolase activator NlpD